MQKTLLVKIAAALVSTAAWLGLAVQFYVTQTNPNLADVSPLERTARYFEYFTIITNLIVAVGSAISVVSAGSWFSRPAVQSAIALYIGLVGIVYNLVLQGLNEFTGAEYIADLLTHDVVPALHLIYWLVFVRKGELNWKMPFVWTVYPIVYLLYALTKASYTGRYPYPFLDVNTLGIEAVLFNSFVLTVVFLMLGELFVLADRVLVRLFTSRAAASL